jgi:hypothetical protein
MSLPLVSPGSRSTHVGIQIARCTSTSGRNWLPARGAAMQLELGSFSGIEHRTTCRVPLQQCNMAGCRCCLGLPFRDDRLVSTTAPRLHSCRVVTALLLSNAPEQRVPSIAKLHCLAYYVLTAVLLPAAQRLASHRRCAGKCAATPKLAAVHLPRGPPSSQFYSYWLHSSRLFLKRTEILVSEDAVTLDNNCTDPPQHTSKVSGFCLRRCVSRSKPTQARASAKAASEEQASRPFGAPTEGHTG